MRVTLYADNERIEGSVWRHASRHQLLTAILSKVSHEAVNGSSVGHYHNVIANSFVAMETIFKVLRHCGLVIGL